MDNKIPFADAPPPYSSTTVPIGWEQPPNPPHGSNPPYPLGGVHPPYPTGGIAPIQSHPPPPLNGTTYIAPPFVHQPPTIAALNATPNRYQQFSGMNYSRRKRASIISGIVFAVFLTIFLIIFFTVYRNHSVEFDKERAKQEEFRKKYFPDSNW